MTDDQRFGEDVLVFMDNEAFSRLSSDERAAYLRRTTLAMKGGIPIITPKTRSLRRFSTSLLIS
jgi:hypothetical protein